MIITSFCEQFLEKYISEEIKNWKNPLKIDKRIIIGLHNWSKNITFKTASKLTEKFNNYLWTLENIDTFFIMEDLISSEKERKIIIDFSENIWEKWENFTENSQNTDNSFWIEIIHYVLTGKFQGFGILEIVYFLLIISIFLLVITYFIF